LQRSGLTASHRIDVFTKLDWKVELAKRRISTPVYDTIRLYSEVEYVVRINPFRRGSHPVDTSQATAAPSLLRVYSSDLAILVNPIYCAEIERALAEMDLAPEVAIV
jgi:hypothetical protein